ncbi:MAG: GHKL domain-containing protein [Elusimicrobia bacterium]|nr:GHKL domain-containing protein [Elusimicrobiota bacterium]
MTGLSTVVFVGTAFNLALPLFILFKGNKKQINFVFFALGMSVALWTLCHGFALRAESNEQALLWTRRIMFGAILLPPFFSWFVKLIENEDYKVSLPVFLTHLTITGYFLFNIFSPQMISDAHWENWGISWRGGYIFNIYSIYYLGFMGYGIYLLAKRCRKTTGLTRTQGLYVLMGASLSAGFGMLVNIALPMFKIVEFNKYGPLGTLSLIGFWSYAIFRYRLMDVNLVFRYTFIYGLFIATLATPMLFIVWWSNSLVVASILILVALGIAPTLMSKWKGSFTHIVDKLAWFQGKYESLKNVGYFERVILGSISPRHWYINMVDSVNRLIETEGVVGYMLDEELDAYLPQAWSGMDRETAIRSMRGEKWDLLELMKERRGIVFRDSLIHELPIERARQIDGMMEVLGAHLCVPFSDGEKIIGFITLGRKLKKGIPFFKTHEILFNSIRDLLDLPITKDKNKIKIIDQLTSRLDLQKGPYKVSDHEIVEALNGLVNEKEFLGDFDLNCLNLRSEGMQLLKKYHEHIGLSKRQKLVLHTAVIRSLLKDEIGPGPEELINAEDIDALTLLFSAGQETLMVMMTAVTQQKRSAEWAHDLRHPFDKGSFRLIDDLTGSKLGPVSNEQKQALLAIKQDSGFIRRKLETLINPQSDVLHLSLRDVRELLEELSLKYELLCLHHKINFRIDLPDLGHKIKCDAEILIFRIFGNLMDNALRHTPAGGSIQIGVIPKVESIVVSINNSGGEPIDPNQLARIFERGTQGGGSEKVGIAGLGLFNVDQAMKANNGKVWVASTKEGGTTFFLEFPLILDFK